MLATCCSWLHMPSAASRSSVANRARFASPPVPATRAPPSPRSSAAWETVMSRSLRFSVVLALFAAPSVVAYTLTSMNFAYEQNPVETPFEFNPANFNEGTTAEAYAAWQDALDTWNIQGGADVYLQDGGSTSASSWNDDGRYIGQWYTSTNDRYTLAVAQYWGYNGRTSDCDIRFYGRNGSGTIYWNMDVNSISGNESDFRDVAVHELGHCLGLNHSNDSRAIMYASSTVGTYQRGLAQDDVDGLVAIYGAEAPRITMTGYTLDDDATGASDGDGDGIIERGETFELDLDVDNIGNVNASSVTATVDESDPDLSIVTGTVNIGNVVAGGSGSTNSALVLTVAECTSNFTATLGITFEDSIGRVWTDAIDVDVICETDNDGDGYAVPVDCDDTNSAIYPGATDTPYDGIDSDCAGDSDYDADGDGADSDAYGGNDCNDNDAAIRPGAQEVCDPNDVDEDCDGNADDADNSVSGQTLYYLDADGDGYSDGATTGSFCDPTSEWVTQLQDCDDDDNTTYPGAPELCDAVNNDCDARTDEGASGTQTWYADNDNDGQGDANNTFEACVQPSGYVADSRDCDDSSNLAFVGGTEECDDLDNDCDGTTDEAGSAQRTFYRDTDGDGYGIDGDTQFGCAAPSGYTSANGDCAPNDAAIHPGAAEVCDGANVDEDCDTYADDLDPEGADGKVTVYADGDGDGYGAGSALLRCDPATDEVALDGDCADGNNTRYPGAPELCNNVDDDCDGQTDENAGDQSTWYADSDGDGYGDPDSTTTGCAQPSGYVANSDDCNDDTALMAPNNTENCDSLDNDCDGATDEAGTNTRTFYEDTDGDGFGVQGSTTQACAEPEGYARAFGDCDDTNPNVNPDAQEICDPDNVDEDCDGAADNQDLSTTGTTRVYRDRDRDGFGNDEEFFDRCDWSANDFTPQGGDCNDRAGGIYPGADEYCNEIDDDCDGTLDEDPVDVIPSYVDTDGDGYGDDNTVTLDCSAPTGKVLFGGDCDESDATINPGADETCGDATDHDCDGSVDEDGTLITWYDDDDNDGYGDDATARDECAQPSGTVRTGGDCDDAASIAYPNAPEACNRADDDCDDSVDEGLGGSTLYEDTDGDGFGDPNSTTTGCPAQGVWVQNADDCNDASAAINPNADEIWYDGVDQNCDGNDDDQDGDGVAFDADCDDLDPQVTTCDSGDTGEEVTDTGTTGDDTADDGGGCGCASANGTSSLWLAPLLGLALRRRRR
ncbi:MAG: matrixin family metalloprotease [Deltaproteobacteria bacterium]|nr:MAG: matrixin family metalloprotease [Deltaproteobacteria bacterium]